MSDDITVKIAAKGCKATGITEDDARRLHRHLDTKVIAIVELTSAAKTEKADGTETVTLNILSIEPAPTPTTEAHLRELQRSFFYERQLEDGQRALDTSIEPKVEDVLRDGARFQPHPFLVSTLALDGVLPVCDVCGLANPAPVHDQHRDATDEDQSEGGTALDEEDEPHAYDDSDGDGCCRLCGRDEGDTDTPGIHIHDEGATITTLPRPNLDNPFTTPTGA